MKQLMIAATVLAAMACTAASATKLTPKEAKEKERREYDAFMKATGGMLTDKRKAVGNIALIDAQKRVDAAFLRSRAAKLEDDVSIRVAYSTAPSPFDMAKLDDLIRAGKGTVSIVLVDCDQLPTALVSMPEKKSVLVNVAELSKDSPDKVKLQDRVAKEISRAACFVFVIPYCNAPGGVMDPIFSVKELDKVLVDNVQVAQLPDIGRSAKNFRMRSFAISTYRDACQEGWAPTPSNDYQRAVWKEVHEPPAAPIKIEK